MADINLLDITSDYIFKLVFGREGNKDVLISLLNAIFKGNPHVEDITLQNSEISKILKNNKTVHLDVRAKIGEKKYVDVEIQCRNTGDIVDRGIHYLSNMIIEGAKISKKEEEDEKSYKYPKVIGVWIMGENLNSRKLAVNEATMTFQKNKMDDYEIASDKIRLFTIELQKFNPKMRNRKDMLDEWITFLKNPTNNEVLENKEISKAFNVLKEVSADEEVREIYRLRSKTEYDNLSERNIAIQKAKAEGLTEGEKIGIERGEKIGIEKGKAEGERIGIEKGKAEGEKIGIEKGKAEGERIGIEKGEKIGAEKERAKAEAEKRKMAKELLKLGLSIEQISKTTNIPSEEIENFR